MSDRTVLVVDDEPDIRSLLQEILEDEGYAVSVADTAASAQSCIQEIKPDLVLLDIWMPDMDGISLLKNWKSAGLLSFPVIMISGHGTVETAVEATRHGAVDFIEKPVSLAKLLLTVEKALTESRLIDSGNESESVAPMPLPLLLGVSDYVKRLQEQLLEQSTQMEPLVILGEGGSGRALFAQALHTRNPALNGRFIQLRCDTVSAVNAHKELFGDESSGAVSMGYLESAVGGTLYLNDFELLPATAQHCLLEAIEQQGFQRAGSTSRVAFHCRIVCASRSDPEVAVQRGSLDPVLFRNLGKQTINLLPLREHPEDIPALLEGFVNWHVQEEGLQYRHFTVAAQNRLRNLAWPGNLLELKNFVQRILLLGSAAEIEVPEINRILGAVSSSDVSMILRHDLPLREARADFERQYLLRCLAQTQGNIGDLAKHVGMERTHLYRKLRSLDIDLEKVRE
ncbi:MAG: sigma-54 dependent transcriptional regulator [Granulosicoccus sp.]|nr:sigma-54 dependent transcriptional regulator [Granulosicoccus sp.]